jgi:hypothetical protein
LITRRLLWSQIRRNEADQVLRLDEPAAACGRYRASVLLGPAERVAVGGLLVVAGERDGAGLSRDGQVAVARPGLKRAGSKLSAHPPDLLAERRMR